MRSLSTSLGDEGVMPSAKTRERTHRPEFLSGLLRYAERSIVRFHTPGHRGGRWAYPGWAQAMGREALSLDLSDVLEGPGGPANWSCTLQHAEERAARLFGARATRFLVNGTSGGIHTAIFALASGREVLFSRASHISVYAGTMIARAIPRYVAPVYDPDWDIAGPPNAHELAQACRAHRPDLIVVTYPDYYGLAIDGSLIVQAAGDAAILADEAHGAHFIRCPKAPPPALRWGCTVSVQSTHKMLGSLTQASMLHVAPAAEGIVFALDQALNLFQTTSPSSLLLASLEAAVVQLIETGHEDWKEAVALAESIRDEIVRTTPFRCLSPEEAANRWQARLDPARLVVNVGDSGWTGLAAARFLREKWQIQVELANQRCLVLLVTPGNTEADGERLIAALKSLSARAPQERSPTVAPPSQPPQRMLPWEALGRPSEWVSLEESVGRVASEIVCPYPPGIPVVVPGEELTLEIVEYLYHVTAQGWEVRGAFDSKHRRIAVVKESGAH